MLCVDSRLVLIASLLLHPVIAHAGVGLCGFRCFLRREDAVLCWTGLSGQLNCGHRGSQRYYRRRLANSRFAAKTRSNEGESSITNENPTQHLLTYERVNSYEINLQHLQVNFWINSDVKYVYEGKKNCVPP